MEKVNIHLLKCFTYPIFSKFYFCVCTCYEQTFFSKRIPHFNIFANLSNRCTLRMDMKYCKSIF